MKKRELTHTQWFLSGLMCICIATSFVRAESAATIAPGDAGVFLEVTDLASWHADWKTDPLVKYVRERIPALPQNKEWKEIQTVMQMDGDELIRRYFGRSFVLVGPTPDAGPAVVAFRTEKADADLAIKRLGMTRADARGEFTRYVSADDKTHLVTGSGWTFVAGKENSNYLGHVIDCINDKTTLSNDEEFKKMLSKLPPNRTITGAARAPEQKEYHAIALTRKNRDIRVHYAGMSRNFGPILRQLAGAKATQFGPLPASTVAAITLNLKDQNPPPNNGFAVGINNMIALRTFMEDVLPGISAPMVLFFGQVEGKRLTPDPGLRMPVFGAAIRITDDKVAADFTNVLNQLMIIANLKTIEWQSQAIVVSDGEHNGVTYRSASVGRPLSERTKRPELAAATLTYGQVGDFYVICTQDEFFKDCIDANADSSKSFVATRDFAATGVKEQGTPIASFVARPQLVSAVMTDMLDHWRKTRPEVFESAIQNPKRAEGKALHGMNLLSGMLDHFQSVSMQSWLDDDKVLHAEVRMTRQSK